MKTKKMITMGVLAMAVWLGLLFQPQTALAANGEALTEAGTGMLDTESRVSDNPQESSRAGGNTGQEAGSSGMMPDAPGRQEVNSFDANASSYVDGDNAVVVDSASTAYSEETSSIISVCFKWLLLAVLCASRDLLCRECGSVWGYCK